ncbi:MAG: hypothetical protein K9K38_04290 [Rhodoferax sp.]|nr:hypothetical protein [Rhodoferax sp.]MCF8208613.1 hypothetical protein [Rhodoferax sp.]
MMDAVNRIFLAWRSLKTRVTLLTLLIFFISIGLVALQTSQMLRQNMQTVLGEQQYSRVPGIAREIDSRLVEREQALQTVAKEITPKMLGDSGAIQSNVDSYSLATAGRGLG